MGLFTLLFALGATIKETIRENAENLRAEQERLRYEDIDWNNIEWVTLDGTETAYRIEEREEFDIVATNFLSEMDGWPHYETETVEYEVEDGENYCFTIKYKNGTTIYRKFHEDSSLTERLLTYVKEDNCETGISHEDPIISRFKEIINDSLELLDTTVNPETYFSRYKIALDNANRILENTNVPHYRDYALEVITDLTQNRSEHIKEFIDRCNSEGRLYFLKEKLHSNNYDIPFEAEEHLNLLLGKSKLAINSKIKNERFAVIDFETTGLNYDSRRAPMDEIISVAIIDQDENVLLDTYCDTAKINSWYEAERINGISPSDVKGFPTFVEIMPKVISILSSYDYVIAYNIHFEKQFLENYAKLYTPTNFSVYKINWGEDPMGMFMDYMNSRKFLKLEAAAEHFGYEYNAHNVLEDTKATLYVYKALRGK